MTDNRSPPKKKRGPRRSTASENATAVDTTTEAPPVSPSTETSVAKRKASTDSKAVQRVMNRVAEGASVRASCRAEGVSRRVFLRRVENDPELRDRYAFAVAARAHALADEMLDIADGHASADELAERIAGAVATVTPEKAEAVARAIVREQIQRDRLRWDARRWLSSRLLPSTYGTASTVGPGPQESTVRIVFDPLPTHALPSGAPPIADAEFEIV